MFYAHFVLAKKGPLARIWLAAHWDKKLTKAHVFETNIEKSVDGILQPKVKMALRTSGHLLLGVVRIYSRKAKYLLADCNEAFVKIKMAFRPGMVDLPEDNREAAVNAITLPEVFHDFDTAMPELNDVDIEAQFSMNQSRAEEITIREDYGQITLPPHEEGGFGDMGFDVSDPPDLLRVTGLEQSLEQVNQLYIDHLEKGKDPQPSTSTSGLARAAIEIDAPIRDDGFGGNLGQDMIAGRLFEDNLFDETPMEPEDVPPGDTSAIPQPVLGRTDLPPAAAVDSEEDDDDHFGGPPSVGGHSSDGVSRPGSAAGVVVEGMLVDEQPVVAPPAVPQAAMSPDQLPFPEPPDDEPPPPPAPSHAADQTTLLHNEEESFALAPVDASALRGFTKAKRKRKLIVDEVKNISGEEMKAQLSDTSDIVTTLDLAPPTKRLMHWKETGGVEKLFALPGRTIPARALFKNYQRHLTSRAAPNDEGADEGKEGMGLEQVKEVEEPLPVAGQVDLPGQGRRGRKRKQLETIEEQQAFDAGDQPMLAEEVASQPQPLPPPSAGFDMLGGPMSVQPPMSVLPPMSIPAPMSVPAPMSIPPLDAPMSVAPSDQPMSVVPMAVEPPTPAPTTPYPGDTSIPDLPPDQVSSLLDPSVLPPQIPILPPQTPFMDNMGFDQENNAMMANMGYDETHPPATTPGAVSERGQATPWNEDYELPVSVGPPEEQALDETYEQFEERVLNKRAGHMYHLVKTKFQRTDQLYLSDLTLRNNRKQVAQKFYSLLVLKKYQVLELTQEASYDEIQITKGPNFENPTL